MEKYKETLNDLTWPELLQQVAAVLARDEKALENNVNYYKKMLN
jgi:predicted transcriptional regulator